MFKYFDRAAHFYMREGLKNSMIRCCSEISFILDLPWLYYSGYLPGYTNNIEICVFALRRSGHHAIINWLRYQAGGRSCFLNDCIGSNNPFQSCSHNGKIASRFISHNHLLWAREVNSKFSKKGTLIYNYEDQSFKEILGSGYEWKREKWLGNSKKRYDVLILRDPFNLLASKLKWIYGKSYSPSIESLPRIVGIWKEQAREYIGETEYLTNKVPILYNQWFLDKNYRQNITNALGLNFNDRGIDEVARWGPTVWGTTSFDKLSYDGRASQMKVLERWKIFKDDIYYRKLIADEELLSLSERIFGRFPGIEEIVN